jgi:hypothetical protein
MELFLLLGKVCLIGRSMLYYGTIRRFKTGREFSYCFVLQSWKHAD